MFELTVQTVFSAAHALIIQGQREPIHGHDWHVTACLTGPELDRDGLLVDFHQIERFLRDITGPFQNANLNETPPFDRINPSAENVARHIATELASRVNPGAPVPSETPGGSRPRTPAATPIVAWVRVTEAPGCAVTYRC